MALLGGGVGGAGNPVGGSFTGPAEALEIVGNHCYAYSGSVTDAGSGSAGTTCLKFTSGNFYSVVDISWGSNSASSSQDEFVNITMNGNTVWDTRYTNSEVASNDQPLRVVIPSYTEFEFKWGIGTDTREVTVAIAGRIYRTRD